MSVNTSYAWSNHSSSFFINTAVTAGNQAAPAILGLPFYFGGNVAVATWDDGSSVQGVGFSATGPSDVEQQINLTTANAQFDSAIAIAGSGLVVSYTDKSVDPGGDIRAYINGEEALINGTTSDDVRSAVSGLTAGNGDYVISWTRQFSGGDNDIEFQIMNGTTKVGSVITVDGNSALNTDNSSVVGLLNGGFVIAYEQSPKAGGNSSVWFRQYDSSGTPIGAAHQIDAVGTINKDIHLVALKDGGFAVAYTDNGYNNANTDISFQIFNDNGTARSNIVRANTTSAGDQALPTITELSNGFIAVGWNDAGNFREQTFTSTGTKVGVEYLSATSVIEGEIASVGGGLVAVVRSSTIADAGGDHSIRGSFDAFSRTSVGDGGNDTIATDSLRDVMTGGGGNDRFVISGLGSGGDTITDFTHGQDKIDLSAKLNTHTLSDVTYYANQDGANTVIDFGFGDTLTLNNVSKASLTASDFIFSQFFKTDVGLVSSSFGSSAAGGGWDSADHFPRMVADVNGDGRADIIGFGSTATYVALATDNGFANPIVGINSFGSDAGGWSNNDTQHRAVADVNGDGKADIVGFGDAGVYVSLATTSGHFAQPTLSLNSFGTSAAAGGWSSDNIAHRELADVNGDSKADIVGFGSDGVYVSLATSDGHFANPFLSLNSFGSSVAAGGWTNDNTFHRELADVNGDGKADIVGFGDNGAYVSLATSDGHFADPVLAINSFGFSNTGGGWLSQDQFPRHLADVNGDNCADIVGFGAQGVYVAEGNYNGTFFAPVADATIFGHDASAGGWSSNGQFPRLLADVDGDRHADIIGFGDAGTYVAHANALSFDFII